MKPPILYIHGFASSGTSSKATFIRAAFPQHAVYAPDLSHFPLQDFDFLSRLIQNHGIGTVIGSSLGGFYALRLAMAYEVNLLMINPSLKPYLTLRDQLGTVSHNDGKSVFKWTEKNLAELLYLATLIDPIATAATSPTFDHLMHINWDRSLTLLGANDDRIDLDYTKRILVNSKIIVDTNADHRFANLTPHFPAIKELLDITHFNGEGNNVCIE
ncbi:MAG: alpha/beta fold hydrolase [Glaciimonas sp.]|nr:alpha/beta fold hydrolase [Glaciimonas sp.]